VRFCTPSWDHTMRFCWAKLYPKNALINPPSKFGNKCQQFMRSERITKREVHTMLHFFSILHTYYFTVRVSAILHFFTIIHFFDFQALLNHRANACFFVFFHAIAHCVFVQCDFCIISCDNVRITCTGGVVATRPPPEQKIPVSNPARV
jgi:hypothetical protein